MLKCYSQTANPGLLREPIKELEVEAKTREKNGVKEERKETPLHEREGGHLRDEDG